MVWVLKCLLVLMVWGPTGNVWSDDEEEDESDQSDESDEEEISESDQSEAGGDPSEGDGEGDDDDGDDGGDESPGGGGGKAGSQKSKGVARKPAAAKGKKEAAVGKTPAQPEPKAKAQPAGEAVLAGPGASWWSLKSVGLDVISVQSSFRLWLCCVCCQINLQCALKSSVCLMAYVGRCLWQSYSALGPAIDS